MKVVSDGLPAKRRQGQQRAWFINVSTLLITRRLQQNDVYHTLPEQSSRQPLTSQYHGSLSQR